MFCNLHPRLQACIAQLCADINLYFYRVNILLGALVRSWLSETNAAETNTTAFKNQFAIMQS